MAPGSNRLLTIGAAAGSLVLLAAVVFMLWPSDPDYAFTSGQEQSAGETLGWVAKVEANTIHVNAGPFGGGVVPLEVTKNTRITAGTKEGWFEDIRPGGQVKVAYDLYNGRRLARTVELLVDEGPRRPIRTEPRVKSTSGGASAERAPAKPGVATTPTPDARPAPTPKAAEPPPVVTAPAAAPAARPAASTKPAPPVQIEARPAPKPEPPRAQAVEVPPAPRTSTAPARSAAPAESSARAQETTRPPAAAPATPANAARAAEPVRPQESGDSTDGSAAVDWFLKGRR